MGHTISVSLTEKISGEKEKHLEILENLRQEIQAIPVPPSAVLELKEKLEESKTKVIKRIKVKEGENL